MLSTCRITINEVVSVYFRCRFNVIFRVSIHRGHELTRIDSGTNIAYYCEHSGGSLVKICRLQRTLNFEILNLDIMYANQQQSANHLYHHFSSEMFVNIIAWSTVGVPGAPKKVSP